MKNSSALFGRWLILLSGLSCTLGNISRAEEPEMPYAWVQYVHSGVEARAVVAGDCPDIELNGQQIPMKTRAGPVEHFPDSVCSVAVPPATDSIRFQGRMLPVPLKATPARIAILGDTGCRVSARHGLYQACHNNSIWPFGRIADSTAGYRPDIIIHTGDYIYRESPCPEHNRGCAGTPYGDSRATWEADWFVPSRALSQSAPLVLVRGNHESCSRAGTGWFRYLGARPWSGECLPSTDPWLVKAGSMRLVILDSSQIKGKDKQPLLDTFTDHIAKADELLDGPGWLLTHRPLWGFGANDDSGAPVEETGVLQEAVRRAGLSADVRMVVSAHIHLAEILGFGDDRPPQLIVANGGTQLVPKTPVPATIDNLPIRIHRTFYQYGFVTVEGIFDQALTIHFRDIAGRAMARCHQEGKQLSC